MLADELIEVVDEMEGLGDIQAEYLKREFITRLEKFYRPPAPRLSTSGESEIL